MCGMELDVDHQILDQLMRALESLESSTDLEGTAIVSKTGLRVCSSETADVVADIYSASPATLISLGEKISSGLEGCNCWFKQSKDTQSSMSKKSTSNLA